MSMLHGQRSHYPLPAAVLRAAKPASLLYGAGAALVMVVGAGFGLYRRRLPVRIRRTAGTVLDPPISVLKSLHSGIAADYVVWLTVGTAVIGGIWAVTL